MPYIPQVKIGNTTYKIKDQENRDISTQNELNIMDLQKFTGILYFASREITHTGTVSADDENSVKIKASKGSTIGITLSDTENTGVKFATYIKKRGATSYTNIGQTTEAGGIENLYTLQDDIEGVSFYKNNLTSGTLTVVITVYSNEGLPKKVDKNGIKQITIANVADIESNILYMQDVEVVKGCENYVIKSIAEYSEQFFAGDIFSIMYDSVDGASESTPVAFFIMNGETEIRRSYSYQLEITTADIEAGANLISFCLYPARGTSMSTGTAIFKNIVVVKGTTEKPFLENQFKTAFLNTFTENNVLSYREKLTVHGETTYVMYKLYEKIGSFTIGETYGLLIGSVTGASDDMPYGIYLYNGNTEIRHVNRQLVFITENDISSGLNKIVFILYPAKGTVLPSGHAVYEDVCVVEGTKKKYAFNQELIENAIIKSNILFEADSYAVRGNSNYVYEVVCDIKKNNMIAGECFSLIYDSVIGATTDYPQAIYLYNNSTEIRHTVYKRLEIVDSDIIAGANRVAFRLYPAKGTGMPTGRAVFTNVRCISGIVDDYLFNGNSGNAVCNVVNESTGYIPDYYHTNAYIDEKVNTIKGIIKTCAANGDAFMFITDEHLLYNRGNSPALISYIENKCAIPRLFNGGDIGDHGSEVFIREFRKRFKGPIHSVCGNHEWMNPITGEELFYMFDMYNTNQIGSPSEHYYYVDNPQKKIRYIVLNSFQKNPNSEAIAAISGYTQEQLAWFTEVALAMPDATWDAIVFTHFIGPYNTSVITGYNSFITAMDEFNSNSEAGKILFVMEGHVHYDAVWHTTGGIPIIATTCDKNAPWIQSGTNMEPWLNNRTDNTIYEQAFDVVLVDRNNSYVKLVRIGCPAYNNVDTDPSSASFSYIPELEIRTVLI